MAWRVGWSLSNGHKKNSSSTLEGAIRAPGRKFCAENFAWSGLRTACAAIAFASALAYANACRATTLPVGPITFDSNADYDNNFKESPTYNGIYRSPNGYLEILGSTTAWPAGQALYDTSATGGVGGQGGTGGQRANCDLSNFTISADLASSVSGQIHAGFLLRLDSSDANGYLATLDTNGPQASFAVFEGTSLTTPGSLIFSKAISTIPFAPAANTFYNLAVTVNGGTFSFDFDHGIATATFTDASVTATSGQVGILLEPPPPPQGGSAQLDNFTIVPEPGTGCLSLCVVFAYFGLRWVRSRTSRVLHRR